MALLNRIRYYTPAGDFSYELSLVFANQVAFETWVANNQLINNVTVLESTAIDEVEGMSIITVGENEPITIDGVAEQVATEEVVAAPVITTEEAPVAAVESVEAAPDTTTASAAENATESVVEAPVEETK